VPDDKSDPGIGADIDTRRRIDAALVGTLPLTELNPEERLLVNAELNAATSERIRSVNFGETLAEEGITTVALDDEGHLVAYAPDGTTTRLDDESEVPLKSAVPALTHAERRTLALHKAVAAKLRADPPMVLQKANANLSQMRQSDSLSHSTPYLDRWEELLRGPADQLLAVMVSTDQDARDLRQASPFAGILDDAERLTIIGEVYEEEHGVPARNWFASRRAAISDGLSSLPGAFGPNYLDKLPGDSPDE
jgi:hypothetical protein